MLRIWFIKGVIVGLSYEPNDVTAVVEVGWEVIVAKVW